jgi:hypothetical protein
MTTSFLQSFRLLIKGNIYNFSEIRKKYYVNNEIDHNIFKDLKDIDLVLIDNETKSIKEFYKGSIIGINGPGLNTLFFSNKNFYLHLNCMQNNVNNISQTNSSRSGKTTTLFEKNNNLYAIIEKINFGLNTIRLVMILQFKKLSFQGDNFLDNCECLFQKNQKSVQYYFDNVCVSIKEDKEKSYLTYREGFYWNPTDFGLITPKLYIYHLLQVYFLITKIKSLKSKDIQRKVFNLLINLN